MLHTAQASTSSRARPRRCTTTCPRRRSRRSCTTGSTAATPPPTPPAPQVRLPLQHAHCHCSTVLHQPPHTAHRHSSDCQCHLRLSSQRRLLTRQLCACRRLRGGQAVHQAVKVGGHLGPRADAGDAAHAGAAPGRPHVPPGDQVAVRVLGAQSTGLVVCLGCFGASITAQGTCQCRWRVSGTDVTGMQAVLKCEGALPW